MLAAWTRRDLAQLLAVMVLAAAGFAWSWHADNFFRADDWGWLGRAHFLGWGGEFSLLPQRVYNDRPVGALLILLGYQAFGLQHEAFHAAGVAVHALNAALLYAVARRLLAATDAALAAALAALWFCACVAVSWTAAVFDLVGATFCLAALLAYDRSAPARRGWTLLALLLHLLALRSKEFAIGLAAVFVAWEWLVAGTRDWRRLWPHLGLTVVFVASYLALHLQQPLPSAYAQDFSPLGLLRSLLWYGHELAYGNAVLSVGLVLATGLLLWQRNGVGIFALVAALALLAAVLPLSAHRDPLYLYAPHFFVALALAALPARDARWRWLSVPMVLAVVLTPLWTGWRADTTRYLLNQGAYARQLFEDFAAWSVAHPQLAVVVIQVSRPYDSPFQYGPTPRPRPLYRVRGPGNAVKILRDDADLRVEVTTDLAEAVRLCRAWRAPLLTEVEGRLRERTQRAECLASP